METKPVHISQITTRTAKNLAQTILGDDTYHRHIKEAARQICKDYPDGSQWYYETQYGSGATIWRQKDTGTAIRITP